MKVCLGTANFFKGYGIRNKKINNENNILDYAISEGVEHIDYSFSYGTMSEQLFKNIKKNNLKIHLKAPLTSCLNQKSFINQFLFFKNKLNDDNIVSLSIHDPWNIKDENVLTLKNIFRYLKRKMPALKIGLSIYDQKDLKFIRKLEYIELIQLAYNPLQRDVFEYFVNKINTDNKIRVHVRSIFMQGLLLLNDIQKYNLNCDLKEYHKKWINFVNKTTYSSDIICINFVKKIQADQVIIGIDNKSQLKDFLENFRTNIKINVPQYKTPKNVSDTRSWEK